VVVLSPSRWQALSERPEFRCSTRLRLVHFARGPDNTEIRVHDHLRNQQINFLSNGSTS
jgi:hypothetical protein